MKETNKLLLIDGNSVAFRAFFAFHLSLERFINHDGLHTNHIYGFKNMLDNILATVQTIHVLLALDAGQQITPTLIFGAYKQGPPNTIH